ncbi:Probable Ufm1-specific protease 2 [Sergentomyia squamirostris]
MKEQLPLTILFSKNIFKRLRATKTAWKGCLYGLQTIDTYYILGYTIGDLPDDEGSDRIKDGFHTVRESLPANLKHLGHLAVDVNQLPKPEDILLKGNISGSCIVLSFCLDADQMPSVGVMTQSDGFQECPYEILENTDLLEKMLLFRVRYQATIAVEPSEEGVSELSGRIREQLSASRVAFMTAGEDFITAHGKAVKSQKKVKDLELSGKDFSYEGRTIFCEVLSCRIREAASFQNRSTMKIKFTEGKILYPLTLEGISLIHEEMGREKLHATLWDSLEQSMSLLEKTLKQQFEKTSRIEACRPYVVKIQDFTHPCVCFWPRNADEADPVLKDRRRELHKIFGLPLTRPFFRKTNSYREIHPEVLQNTHVGLKGALQGGQQYLVQGVYSYYHYMQQGFNDNGWGCAYRSFQTIFSWFRHQGYTDHPVPTHKNIQEALVTLGDKQKSFLGSTQWIGSTEVGLCLEKFLNVSSRIMFCQSGSELVHKGAELAMHFESQGTPIMIGGGVLAHTIIGVDFNRLTGETKFLILDPHYTGSEDLHTIQQKGFCSWKTGNFWDKKSYYNLCMPIRPVIF